MERKIAREALRLLDAHQAFVQATVVETQGSVPGKLGAAMIVRADGSTLGTIGGAALEERVKELASQAMRERRGDLHHFDLRKWATGGLPSLCGGSVTIALDVVPARPNLLLWGGGHVAKALADILPTLEYDFTVADDRPEWVGADRFPLAEERHVVGASALMDAVDPSRFTHLYILGYDAGKDTDVLASALDRFPNFIGVISSASKRAHMFADLRKRGVPETALSRIRAPVGLDIGAERPAEIAVAIVAEIVRSNHPSARPTEPTPAATSAPERDVVA